MKSLKLLLTVLFLGLFVANVFAASEKGSMASTTVQKLKPKEIKVDRNNDGKVDRVEIFNDQGVLIRVETDTKGDGKIHEWVYYENGKPVKAEKDSTGDGKPDTWLTY